MSHSYVIRPSTDTTTASFPTIARISSTNRGVSDMADREFTPPTGNPSRSNRREPSSRARSRNAIVRRAESGQYARENYRFRAAASPSQSYPGGRQPRARRQACEGRRKGGEAPLRVALAPLRADFPGIARGQQLGDIAGAAVGQRVLLLVDEDVLVDRCGDVFEDADGPWEVRREEVGEQLGRVDVLLVVDPQRALGHAIGVHHIRRHDLQNDGLAGVGRA